MRTGHRQALAAAIGLVSACGVDSRALELIARHESRHLDSAARAARPLRGAGPAVVAWRRRPGDRVGRLREIPALAPGNYQLERALHSASTARTPATDALSGGDGTVFDETRNAFSLPARNLLEEHRPSFFVGNSFFNQNWVIAPASVAGRDGLGPLFNVRSCSGCHFKDGRSRPPEPEEPMTTMLLRISVPGIDAHGGPRPEPVYGDQIQGQSIPGAPKEADVFVRYAETAGTFADDEMFSLRSPSYRIANLGYGPISPQLLVSPRVSPAVIGLGLLEAIPEATLHRLADPDDADGDGISGHLNRVWNQQTNREDVGRFGWKAEQPSVLQQTAAAFVGDIGITSSLFGEENHTGHETAAALLPSGGTPELSETILQAVGLYARSLAVPAARVGDDPQRQRGWQLFAAARCGACHLPELRTAESRDLPEFANQIIHPYTDLLLHDMGEGLADNRPTFTATGREWRTAPLWGLGLIAKVNGHTFLLHDGRARNVTEAILWHDGEARASRERFRTMSKADRSALLAFLDAL
jgi:CxxC motif-containing protein (DUF1111 family)